MSHPVVWFEVIGNHAERLQQFYSELFDWKIDANNPMKYGMVNTGSKDGIPGGVGPTENGGKTRVTFYVRTDDAKASLSRAEKLGGKTIMPVTKLPETTIALFADPDGNVVGLVEEPG